MQQPNPAIRPASALLVFAITLLLFWPGLTGPFLFDDLHVLVSNDALHITQFSIEQLKQAAFSFDMGGGGRTLAMLTFGINHVLTGLEPYSYKLTGVLIHALNAVLVYCLLRHLLHLAGFQARNQQLFSLLLALLWSIHPIQVSSALYVVQRMETLSLTFVLLALLAYLHGRQRQLAGAAGWHWMLFCLPLVALGLSSKETAALFPVYTLVLELTLLGFAAQSPRTANAWRWLYTVGSLLALALFVLVIVPHYGTLDTHTGRDFNTAERLLSQLRILPMYLGQILLPLPANLYFYYDDFVPSRGWLEPASTLLGGVFLLGLLLVAWLQRRRMPLFALGVGWFFAAHAITSNVVALELVFEHRNYFALLGVLLALAGLMGRLPLGNSTRGFRLAGATAIFLAVAALGAIRSATWGDELLLAVQHAAFNPDSARAAHELGVVYYGMTDGYTNSPFFSFARQQFERESALPQATILADQALIILNSQLEGADSTAYWDALDDKLKQRPVTVETTHAMFALMDNRYAGRAIDDARLLQAFDLMFDKIGLPPYSYAQVADHAWRHMQDEDASDRYLIMAVAAAEEHPAYVNDLASQLNAQDRPEQAALVIAAAKELGIQ